MFTVQEDIEVKKDTERADEIRAMKKAWEEHDPGRAAKVRSPSVSLIIVYNKKLIEMVPGD